MDSGLSQIGGDGSGQSGLSFSQNKRHTPQNRAAAKLQYLCIKKNDMAETATPPELRETTSEVQRPRIGLRTTLRALRHRNFQLFFSGQLISLIGTWMQNIAQDWLVYRLTGSSVLLGTVAFVNQIPIFLLAPVAGIVADRWNRHRIVIATQSASMVLALTLATLTLTGRIRIWEIMVLASLLGVVNAFDIPARQAFLIDMVGRDDLLNAIALNSSMFNGARIIGPAIAGILVASVGEGWCFFGNGLSYIAVITGLLLMRLTKQRDLQKEGSPLENMIEGFRFARHTAPVRALLLLIGFVSFAAMPYTVLMPIFAGRVLHGGAGQYSMLMGTTGIGALLGALTLASKTGVSGLGKWVWMAATGFGSSLILFSLSRHLWLSLALLIPTGFGMMVQMGATNTLLQVMVPDRLRGRVMSLYSMMFIGMGPIGAFVGGLVAGKIGAPWTVAIGGLTCLVGGAVFARRLPAMRGAARQLILAQGMSTAEPPASLPVPRP
jgi:MFS family permease